MPGVSSVERSTSGLRCRRSSNRASRSVQPHHVFVKDRAGGLVARLVARQGLPRGGAGAAGCLPRRHWQGRRGMSQHPVWPCRHPTGRPLHRSVAIRPTGRAADRAMRKRGPTEPGARKRGSERRPARTDTATPAARSGVRLLVYLNGPCTSARHASKWLPERKASWLTIRCQSAAACAQSAAMVDRMRESGITEGDDQASGKSHRQRRDRFGQAHAWDGKTGAGHPPNRLSAAISPPFLQAVETIGAISGRVIVTGVGKGDHIGVKIAATLASTGTPAFFACTPPGANHGDLGMVGRGDAARCWRCRAAEASSCATSSPIHVASPYP